MLTAKQEAFCLAFVECGNASEAYRRAGYSPGMADKTVNEAASRMLKNSKVEARIAALRQPAVDAAVITLESHLSDLKELRLKAETDGKYSAAVAAEIARGKAAGIYVEKIEHAGPGGTPIQIDTSGLRGLNGTELDTLKRLLAKGREALEAGTA